MALSAGTPPPRLSELIVGTWCRPAPFARPATAMPRTALEGSRVILADSVAVYADATRRAGHPVRFRDLPNLLPPHRRCFIEMRGVEGRVSRWGAYLATSPAGGDAGSGAGGAGRWLVRAGLITVVGDDVPVGPVLLYRWHLDDMGRMLADPRGPAPSGLSVAMPRLLTTPPGGSREAFKTQCTRNYFTPLLLALAFLHCEETTVEPVDLATAGAPAGRLRLQPFEALLARAARAGTSAAQAAAELVPGRFEDGRRRLSTGISGPIRWRPENADDLLHRRSG